MASHYTTLKILFWMLLFPWMIPPYKPKRESRGHLFSDEFTVIWIWHLINCQSLKKDPIDISQTFLGSGKKERDFSFLFLVGEENAVSNLLPATDPHAEWRKYIHYQQKPKLVRKEPSKGVFDMKKHFVGILLSVFCSKKIYFVCGISLITVNKSQSSLKMRTKF